MPISLIQPHGTADAVFPRYRMSVSRATECRALEILARILASPARRLPAPRCRTLAFILAGGDVRDLRQNGGAAT